MFKLEHTPYIDGLMEESLSLLLKNFFVMCVPPKCDTKEEDPPEKIETLTKIFCELADRRELLIKIDVLENTISKLISILYDKKQLSLEDISNILGEKVEKENK